MVLFFPIEQELDCINSGGHILGKIRFDIAKDQYIFDPDNESIVLSGEEEASIAVKLAALTSGASSMPMLDED